MHLRVAGRTDHVRVGDGAVGKAEIVLHGAGEQEDVLIHHRHGGGERRPVIGGHGLAVKENLALPRLIQPRHQPRDGGFAAARRTHQRHLAAGGKLQREVLQNRRGLPGITEGHITDADLPRHGSGDLLVIARSKDHILLVIGHVFNTLHTGTHLRHFLSRGDHLRRRGHEGLQQALQCQQHTGGQLAVNDQQRAQRHQHHIGDIQQQTGNRAQIGVDLCNFRLSRHHGGLHTRPLGKHAFLRAAGLDGLHHIQDARSGAGQHAAVTGNDPRDLHPPAGDILRHEQVEHQRRHANERQHRADGEHHDQVHRHGDQPHAHRREGVHEGACNGGVILLTACNVTCHSLGEKLHGQMQHMNQIRAVGRHSKPPLHVILIGGRHRQQQELQHRHADEDPQQRHEPGSVRTGEDLIHKAGGQRGLGNAENRRSQP